MTRTTTLAAPTTSAQASPASLACPESSRAATQPRGRTRPSAPTRPAATPGGGRHPGHTRPSPAAPRPGRSHPTGLLAPTHQERGTTTVTCPDCSPATSGRGGWDRVRFHAAASPGAVEEGLALPAGSPERAAAAVIQGCVEVLCGRRPVHQLTRWVTPELYEAVERRAALAAHVLGPCEVSLVPRLRSCHAQVISPERCEVIGTLDDGHRARAAAARLRARHGRWVLASLDIL